MEPAIANAIKFYLIFIVSGSAHEFSHAFAAYRLGDPTARDAGRMTLNPLAHIDPIGTVLVPLINMMSGFPFLIGWMRPVPVFPLNLQKRYRDGLLISLAGPFTNFAFAFTGFAAAVLLWMLGVRSEPLVQFVSSWIEINMLLGLFNLLPIPPLDGSSIVDFIRRDDNESYHSSAGMGTLFLYAFVIFGGFSILYQWVVNPIYGLMVMWPFLPFIVLALLVAVAVIFMVKTSTKIRRPTRKKPRLTEPERIYEKARAIGEKLKAGESLTRADDAWLADLRKAAGDGRSLCAPFSYRPGNRFCIECPNFLLCAARLVDTVRQGAEAEEG